jgi:hypothetical protein
MNNDTLSLLGNVITIDDERIKSHLDRVVRQPECRGAALFQSLQPS